MSIEVKLRRNFFDKDHMHKAKNEDGNFEVLNFPDSYLEVGENGKCRLPGSAKVKINDKFVEVRKAIEAGTLKKAKAEKAKASVKQAEKQPNALG